MRLESGTPAPPFSVTDVNGQVQSLPTGQRTLLMFFRYASCPFCNLHLHQVTQRAAAWQAQGLRILAVFQSPAPYVRERLGRHHAPFPIIADPEWQLYRQFGVETSWLGYLRGSANPAIMTAFSKGFLPGAMHGPKNTLPADFLVGADGRLEVAYYGDGISRHLPIDRIEAWLDSTGSTAAA